MPGHTGLASSVSFDPSGTRLASGGADGVVRVWELDPDRLAEIVEAKLTRGFTDAECRRYLRQDSCPVERDAAEVGAATDLQPSATDLQPSRNGPLRRCGWLTKSVGHQSQERAMAYTTHPNQLDTKRGLRAGLIGLAVVLFAAVAALGYSVVIHDSETAPAVVDFPTVDEMRAENMEIRHQVAAAAAVRGPSFPSNDEMRAENQIIRDQVRRSGRRRTSRRPRRTTGRRPERPIRIRIRPRLRPFAALASVPERGHPSLTRTVRGLVPAAAEPAALIPRGHR